MARGVVVGGLLRKLTTIALKLAANTHRIVQLTRGITGLLLPLLRPVRSTPAGLTAGTSCFMLATTTTTTRLATTTLMLARTRITAAIGLTPDIVATIIARLSAAIAAATIVMLAAAAAAVATTQLATLVCTLFTQPAALSDPGELRLQPAGTTTRSHRWVMQRATPAWGLESLTTIRVWLCHSIVVVVVVVGCLL